MSDKQHITSIGGQAVLEGIMMKGPSRTSIAVRKPDGEILLDIKETSTSLVKRLKLNKIPIVRGIFAFIDSIITGVTSLMFSADAIELEDDVEEVSKFDKFLEKVFGDKLKNAVMYFAVFLSLILGIGMFILLPTVISGFIRELFTNGTFVKFPSRFISAVTPVIDNAIFSNLLEGIIRMAIFLTYMFLVSKMEDIKTVFRYHGAEHKTIFCYESGEELTVENVRKQTRFHPRCGTSFLLIVMVVSIIIFSFISWSNPWTRMGMRLLLLPVVAGISYEFIKLAGRSKNKCVAWLTKPGLWLQRLTTGEPNDSQIEVAIEALKVVIPESKEEDKW